MHKYWPGTKRILVGLTLIAVSPIVVTVAVIGWWTIGWLEEVHDRSTLN